MLFYHSGYFLFTDFFSQARRAGCPYDNAVIERFYNTFKNEFFNLYSFNDYEVLDKKTYEFIYIKYNYLRPHSYNNGIPPALGKRSA
ncbi:integrase core domain-containing protein [Sebaldella sp. S0638]|uniref:integrase core domain-containing protein n=1 Tax=Sebaldella sp. S0638 TaxID=2957809 RepID=UPI0035327DA0